MLLFLRLNHSCLSKLLPERAETRVYGTIEIRSPIQVPGSLAEGGSEARKLSSNPSFQIILEASFLLQSFCLAGLARLVSCGTWLAYFPFPLGFED
jgi:hypothetical protein